MGVRKKREEELPNGLELRLTDKIVSMPYIKMTLNLMAYFGVNHNWDDQTIIIPNQEYTPKTFTVEADWSAASYYYSIAAFADENLDLQLNGLFNDSLQGDAVIAQIGEYFGVATLCLENLPFSLPHFSFLSILSLPSLPNFFSYLFFFLSLPPPHFFFNLFCSFIILLLLFVIQ